MYRGGQSLLQRQEGRISVRRGTRSRHFFQFFSGHFFLLRNLAHFFPCVFSDTESNPHYYCEGVKPRPTHWLFVWNHEKTSLKRVRKVDSKENSRCKVLYNYFASDEARRSPIFDFERTISTLWNATASCLALSQVGNGP